MRRRVVITGMGVLSAVGSGDAFWPGVLAGRSPVQAIDRFDPSPFRSRVAAQIDDFDPLDHMDARTARALDRFSQFGLAAGRRAMQDAALEPGQRGAADPQRIGIYLGSALGGIAFAEAQHERYLERGIKAVAPTLALAVFGGAAPANLGIALDVRGPILSTANSCASGAVAIGEALGAIRNGEIDAAIAGGVEVPLSPLAFGAFDIIRALGHGHNDDPAHASRPFDRERDGFVMGEGAALLVLEAADIAERRGARPYAEVMGYGATSDAHHMVQPRADGLEAARAATIALEDADVGSRGARLRQRARVVDAHRRHRGGTRARPRARWTADRPAGGRDEGAHRTSAGCHGRDRGGDVRPHDPRRDRARNGEPGTAGRRDRGAPAVPAPRAPTRSLPAGAVDLVRVRRPQRGARLRGARRGTILGSMTTDRTPPIWEARFRVPLHSFPHWSPSAPDRLVITSSESGSYQAHTWDPETGERRKLSDEAVGATYALPTADGEWVTWFRDISGDESGAWMVVPRTGGTAEPLFDDLPKGWPEGLVLRRGRSVVGLSDADGFAIWVVDEGQAPRLLVRSTELFQLGGGSMLAEGGEATLSADDRLLVVEHAEHGDLMHAALRVYDVDTGAVVADLRDEGMELVAFPWSPVPGDDRLAIGHERDGERAPAIWHVRTGEVQRLDTGLEGMVEAVDWWPDASALLLIQLIDGRDVLHRYDLATGRAREVCRPSEARSPAPASGPTARSGTATSRGDPRRACWWSAGPRRSWRPRPLRPAARSRTGDSKIRTGRRCRASSCVPRATGRGRR